MRDVDEFYVGYLPVPAGQLRFVRRIVCILLVTAAAIGVAVAVGQRDAGQGVWRAETVETFAGVARLQPYPSLDMQSANGSRTTLLLVDPGKHSAYERVREFDGKAASVHGHRIQRGTLQLIELADEAAPIVAASNTATPATCPTDLANRITLQGEIIDPKCHGGAMKPGDGKTHKSCAVLCLRGGIPPVFATPMSDGALRYYLIVDQTGQSLSGEALEAIFPFVADPIEVTGVVTRDGDQWQIRLNAADIRRL